MNVPYANVIPALWLAWLVYWMIAAGNAKATQRVESSLSRATHIVPLVIAGWLLSARTAPGGFLGQRIFTPGAATYLAAVLLVASGLGFAVWARVCLGRNWSGVVTLKQDHELVRSGPYRLVRHPIYTGLLLAFIGSALARDEWRGVVAVAIAWFALWRKLQIEERWMIEQFGDAYTRYRAEVPALVTNPFRRAGTRNE
ncbi:MAG TPA: isoprenylcysteine carboxylmethyltransferase family protein [Rudaea sp.]|jgi:protein-S-isoprenylcysteine O-methyltransferase Ste14